MRPIPLLALPPLTVLVAVLLPFLLPGSLPAEVPAPVVSLGSGIPEDYFLYLRRTANPEREFLEAPLAAAGKAAVEAGVHEAAFNLVARSAGVPAGERAQWRRVLETVDWGKLLGREYALGARFDIVWRSPTSLEVLPTFDWVALFRVDPAGRDAQLAALRKVLLAFATLWTGVEVVDARREGVPITLLDSRENGAGLCLGGRDDVVAVASSPREMRRALRLLAGEGSGRGIVEGDAYRRSMRALPAPEDGELLFRPSAFFRLLRQAARTVEGARVQPALADLADELVRSLDAVVDAFDVVDLIGVSETTEGRRLNASYRIELTEEASRRSLYAPFAGRPSLQEFSRLVPRDAAGFTISSGLDLGRLHQAAVGFMEKGLSEGPDLLDDYRRLQEKAGFNVKEDLLELFEGRAVFLTYLPGATDALPGPFGHWVALFRLQDPAVAEARIKERIEDAAERLKALGAGPERVEVPDVPGDFYRLALPFPPGVEVTFGVSGGELAAGTSRERIREAFRVRAGKTESIASSAEFGRLGLSLPAELHAVAYRDLGDLLRKARGGLAGLGLLSAMMEDGKKGKGSLAKDLLTLAARLGPVLDSLGFLDLAGAYLARDGNALAGQVTVTTLPLPPPPGPPEKKDGKAEKSAGEKRRTF